MDRTGCRAARGRVPVTVLLRVNAACHLPQHRIERQPCAHDCLGRIDGVVEIGLRARRRGRRTEMVGHLSEAGPAQMARPVAAHDNERDAARLGFDKCGQQIGHRGSRRGHDRHGRAVCLGHTEGGERAAAFVGAHERHIHPCIALHGQTHGARATAGTQHGMAHAMREQRLDHARDPDAIERRAIHRRRKRAIVPVHTVSPVSIAAARSRTARATMISSISSSCRSSSSRSTSALIFSMRRSMTSICPSLRTI